MASELAPIDIRHVPALAALVEEVRVTRKPRRIVRDDEDVALLVPAPTAKRRRLTDWRPSPAALAAAVATFGTLADAIDPETFQRQRRELQVDDTPPRSL